jgi:hypothetical protein
LLTLVVRAVDLYGEPCFLTVEVQNEVADRMLTAKLGAEAATAQSLPEQLLAMGHLLALLLGEGNLRGVGN